MRTDRLILEAVDGTRMSVPWLKDEWPPPLRIYVANAQEGVVVIDPTKQSNATMITLITEHGAARYDQVSASSVEEPAGKNENWFRGALYKIHLEG